MQAPTLDDKVEHHFIAFVEKGGQVFELDGRKEGPISHGSVDGKSFLQVGDESVPSRWTDRKEGRLSTNFPYILLL